MEFTMTNEKNNNFDKINFSKYLLAILILAFIFSSISGIMFMSNKYNIIIGKQKKVNINEFVSILNNEKRAFASLKLTEEQLAQLNSREFMLSTLSKVLYSKLIDMEIENFGIQKPRYLILDDILLEENFHTDGKFDIKKLEGLLERYNITEQEYIKIIQNSDNKKFLLDTIVGINNINNQSLNIIHLETNKYKNIDVFKIEKGRLKSYNGDVSEEEMKHFYNSNISRFVVPEERQVDYIKLTDYTIEQINKIETLKSKGLSIQEIAKKMGLKVETYGFIKKKDIENDEKYKDMPDVFEFTVGKISGLVKIEKDAYFYCVVKVKESKVKDIKEVERDIKLSIQDIKTNEIRLEKVKEIAEDYKKRGFNSNFLISNGFTIIKNKNKVNHKSEEYNKDFLEDIMATKSGNITGIFEDENNIYFAFVKSEGILTANDKDYVDIDNIKKMLVKSDNDKLLIDYTNYLRDQKYKLRINYKLLDLIK